MSVALWTWVFGFASVFWAWVVFGGGADVLEETALITWLVGWIGMNWSAQGIRIYAGGTWLLTGGWYLLGLVEPSLRWPGWFV